MSKMGSHEPFGHLQHKLWQKESPGVKLAIWLPTTKSQELTRPWCVQVEFNTPLKISQRRLQLCFRPHHDRRSIEKIMRPQSRESLICWNFGTLTWESRDKKPFGCGPCGELQSILHGGRWWLPLSPGCGESCESCESKVARGSF
jgi:hypothetical protein